MRGSCCLPGGWATTRGNQGQGGGREGFHKEEEEEGEACFRKITNFEATQHVQMFHVFVIFDKFEFCDQLQFITILTILTIFDIFYNFDNFDNV